MHGYNEYYSIQGQYTYKGEYKEGMKNGQGIIVYSDDSNYGQLNYSP